MSVEHQLWQVKVGKENLFYFVPSASNVPKETQGTLSLTEPNNKANFRKAGFWLKTRHPLTDVMMQITNCLFYHLEMLWGFFLAYLYGDVWTAFHPDSNLQLLTSPWELKCTLKYQLIHL